MLKKPGAITRKAAKAASAAKTHNNVSRKGKRENSWSNHHSESKRIQSPSTLEHQLELGLLLPAVPSLFEG